MAELSGLVYHCSAGETFDTVALNVYGHERHAADLMNANPGLVLKTVFTGGEVLALPVVETISTHTENVYTPATAPWRKRERSDTGWLKSEAGTVTPLLYLRQ